jgi:hypothetical protein
MNHESDLEALLDAAVDADTARELIAAFHARVRELQVNSDALRVDNALLKRGGGSSVSVESMRQLRTDLRDLREFARKNNLDQDVLAFVTGTGAGMLLPEPVALEQTLGIEMGDTALRDLRPVHLAPLRRLGGLIAMTSGFRLLPLQALALPLSPEMRWADARGAGGLGLSRGERIEALCAVPEPPPKSLLVVTRSGWCRALAWSSTESVLASGAALTPEDKADTPVWIGPADSGDVLLVTRLGRWVRFPLGMLEPVGQRAISLEPDDDVACAVIIRPDAEAVQFVSGDGALIAMRADALPAHKKPGGKSQPLVRNWISQSAYAAPRNAALALLSATGELHVTTLRGLPVAAKAHEARPLTVTAGRVLASAVIGG